MKTVDKLMLCLMICLVSAHSTNGQHAPKAFVPILKAKFSIPQLPQATAVEQQMIEDVKSGTLTEESLKKYLSDEKFNINAQAAFPGTETTITALMQAVKYNNVPTARLLLKYGADSNAQDNQGSTALSHAIVLSDEDGTKMLKLLLAKGADPNRANLYGFTPLSYAIGRGMLEAVHLLLATKKVNLEQQDQMGTTPLMEAAFIHNPSIFDLLLKQGAQVDARDDYGWTGLMQAAENGDKIAVLMFLGADANPFLQSYDKATIAEKIKGDPEYQNWNDEKREREIEHRANKTFFSLAGKLVFDPYIQAMLII